MQGPVSQLVACERHYLKVFWEEPFLRRKSLISCFSTGGLIAQSIRIVCLDPQSHFQNDISPLLSALFEDPDSGFSQFLFPQGDNLPREGTLG